MKFGVILPQFGNAASPQAIQRMANAAEDLGWDSVWLSDHIVIPKSHVGQFSETFYELFTTMGYIAACTERVSIGTSVIVLPYRHPVTTAKQIATADQLSGGRLIIGVAFGWTQKEYEILDVPYEKRGRRSDECIQVMKECWTAEDPQFAGEFYQFSDLHFSPRPVQQPHPPLWIGGNDHKALQRTVKFADGWHPISGPRIRLTMDEFSTRIETLKQLAQEQGRDPAEITLSLHTPLAFSGNGSADMDGNLSLIGPVDAIRRRLDKFIELGLSHLIISCFYGMNSLHEATGVDGFIKTMEQFSEQVMD